MKTYPFGLSSFTLRAQSNRGKFTFLGSVVRLLLVLWVAEMVASLPAICISIGANFPTIYSLAEDVTAGLISAEEYQAALEQIILAQADNPIYAVASYVGLCAVVAGGFFYMLVLDHRPLHQTGVLVEQGKKKVLPLFALLGALVIGLIALVVWLSGAVSFTPSSPSIWHLAAAVTDLIGSCAYLIFFLGAFLPVILSHTRGFWRGAIWTSVMLGIYLTPYTGVSILASVNGCLLALVLVLLTVRTGHIWSAVLSYGAMRVLGDVLFGDPAYAYLPHAILDPTFAPGRDLTHGGVGGYMGGLGTTLILALSLIAILYIPRRAAREDTSAFTQSSL